MALVKLMHGLEKKYKVFSFLSPLTMIGEVVMETSIPLMMARIIDIGVAESDLSYVLRTSIIMILMSCFSLACGALGGRFAAVASLGFARNIRRRLFSKVQEFSFSNIDRFSTSSLVTRLTTDVTNVQNTYQMFVRTCVRAPFMLVSGTILAFFINKQLSSIFLIAIPLLALALAVIGLSAYPRFRVMLKHYDGMNETVRENLSAIRVVKSYVREDFENKKFDNAAGNVRNTQVRAERIVILNGPLMQAVVYLCIITALWFGGKMIVFGGMKTGELVSFITYITQILMSLMMLSMVFITFVLARASISRILEVLEEEPEIKNPCNAFSEPVTEVKDGSIDFKDVSFSYTNDISNCVLKDINLHINSGQLVGILGGTGSSKSTLVSLIPRLYDVTRGQVSVGGVDVHRYDLKTLRDCVAVVLQKNVLFSGTIRSNLLWGNENAGEEEIVAACRAADAHGFISSLPDGYETELGQGGVNLSGGQKQRICIARALLKNPKVLILDDSTSAVDTATDARIKAALRSSHNHITKIIIAQRISSLRDADVIYVMDNGTISGVGTHEELLETNGIYREIYESQQARN